MVIFNHFWDNLTDTLSRNTHTHTHTHTHTFAANFKKPANHRKPMHGSVDQVKDLCDRSCHVTSKKANVIRSISCLYFFSGSLLSSGQSPSFLIWLSMPFTSTESYLVIPLSLVFFSYLPSYHPAWPHLQTHWAAASFCIHHALPYLCKCQVSSWSFFHLALSHLPSTLFSKLRPSHLSGHSLRPVYMLHLCTFITFCIYLYWSLDVPVLGLLDRKLL